MLLQLDFDFNTCGQLKGHKSLDGLLGRVHDVDEALVGAALKLFAAVLVLMNSAQDGDDLCLGGQRDGAGDGSIGALGSFNDGFGCLVDELMVIGLESDADHVLVACHLIFPPKFSYVFSTALGSVVCPVRMKLILHTQPCVSNPVRKTNRPFSRSDSVQVIYAVHRMLQPPDCVPAIQPIPDILHESYLVFTSNLPLHRIIRPLATHRRFIRITKLARSVKNNFCIFRRIFNYFFVKAYQYFFATISCVFRPVLTLLSIPCSAKNPVFSGKKGHIVAVCNIM